MTKITRTATRVLKVLGTKLVMLGVGCQLALLLTLAAAAHYTVAAPTTAPAVLLSTTVLSYGDETVGSTSAPQSVSILNSGDADLTITSTSPSGDYAVDSGDSTCGGSLAAGLSCEVAVTFAPTVAGLRKGTLTLTDTAADSPQTVQLLGNGVTTTGPLN